MNCFILLMALFAHITISAYQCDYTCNTDPLEQIYPNQNMCVLLQEIPAELKNLSYIMYPNCDIYNTNRFNYNKRFNIFPHAIITPNTPQEVQYVLSILTKYKLPFAVRSGGHCYGPGSLSNGYVIDLRNFNAIIPNIQNETVVIGAGCRLGDVISALGAIDYAIPTGTCPSVGITGLALGGGIGLLARKYGLTADSIISITLITADGSIIEVTKKNHPNLFWALCGAGANSYGIVLGFTFKMYYIPEVSLIRLSWDWDPTKLAAIIDTWQKWFPAQSTDITSELVPIYRKGKSELKLNAMKVGNTPFTEWEKAFKKFSPKVKKYKGNYLGAAKIFASNYIMPFSKVKSKFLFEPLSNKGIKQLISIFSKLQNHKHPYLFFYDLGGAAGGAIQHGDTAYFPRDAYAWNFQFIYWPHEFQSRDAIEHINETYCQLAPYTSPYSYANLIDYDLGNDYLHAYYGDHIKRLVKIKNQYDPDNVFTWRQGIPLSYTPPCCPTDQCN